MNKTLLSILILAAALLPGLSACDSKSDRGGKSHSESVETAAPVQTAGEKNIREGLPTVIDFYATWCGPCKQISPLFDRLKVQYDGQVNFVRVDVDADPATAREYGIEAMPTFVILDAAGKEVNRIIGADADGLRKAVQELSTQQN